MSLTVFGVFMREIADFSSVTEIPGSRATSEQLARLSQRYDFARNFVEGNRVLEVGCGAGVGLGYLSHTAQQVVGGDYTPALLQVAQKTYHAKLPLVQLDAHALPFAAYSFDVIILFETIYYLTNAFQFVRDSRRVLVPGGILLIGTVNREWDGFSPSPFSQYYYSQAELLGLLMEAGFKNIELYGGFPVQKDSIKQRLIQRVRRVFVTLGLMPKTLRGRAFLKRLVYGKLKPIPAQLTEISADNPIPLANPNIVYTILYAVAENTL